MQSKETFKSTGGGNTNALLEQILSHGQSQLYRIEGNRYKEIKKDQQKSEIKYSYQ